MPSKQLNFYLKKVNLKGFKSIENLTVELEKGLNILIGKNLSGKSNFLEGLEYALKALFIFPMSYSKLEFISPNSNTVQIEIEKIPNLRGSKKLPFEEKVHLKYYFNNEKVADNLSNDSELINSVLNDFII
ncbi:MAG: AAA family ATPase [Bacteroidota bacterium]